MLKIALDYEVLAYLNKYSNVVDENDHQLLVRNGYNTERCILSGAGVIGVSQPRVNDKSKDQLFTFYDFPAKH